MMLKALGLVWLMTTTAGAADTNQFFADLARSQAGIKTWTAGFIQTRSLKSLAQPLTTRGKIWFIVPDQFRWELGDPAQTVAIRQTNQLLVIYPRLKRAEKYAMDGRPEEPWREALALLDAGFPRDRAELEARFRLLSLAGTTNLWTLNLAPRSTGARRMITEIQVGFRPGDFALLAHEVRFADGSTLRNDFTNIVLNATVEPAQLSPVLPPDFKISEPLKKNSP